MFQGIWIKPVAKHVQYSSKLIFYLTIYHKQYQDLCNLPFEWYPHGRIFLEVYAGSARYLHTCTRTLQVYKEGVIVQGMN
jgi:hypothetical protein